MVTGILFSDISFFRNYLLLWDLAGYVNALHVIGAYLFALYLIVHLYMATLGRTAFSHTKAMITRITEGRSSELGPAGSRRRLDPGRIPACWNPLARSSRNGKVGEERSMAKYGGWAGKVLHVDLSTGRTWTEDTVEKYKDFLGGTGIGYKVIWDEVPAGTKPYDPENKIIFAVGPLAGTGAPCNGRTAITTLWPTCWPKPLVATGHMGGQFAAKLKYAGYDALVIRGKADRPVWLSIVDQQVEIHDARRLWGEGIRRTTAAINQIMGPEAVVAAIGQAGENLVPMSVVMSSVSHSAGGIGSVMGAKNLKAIGVQGTGSVRIAGRQRGVGEADQIPPLPSGGEQPARRPQRPAALVGIL